MRHSLKESRYSGNIKIKSVNKSAIPLRIAIPVKCSPMYYE